MQFEVEVERGRRTEQRMQELLVVSGELAAAPDRPTIVRLAVEAGRAAVGAQSAGLWLVTPEGDALQLVAASESSELDAQRYGRIPFDSDTPAGHVVRTGEPVFIASESEYEALFPTSFARVRDLGSGRIYKAVAMLPL